MPKEDIQTLREYGYKTKKAISAGAYGSVVKADYKKSMASSPLPVAVKIIRLAKMNEYERRILSREITFLSMAKHPHILQMLNLRCRMAPGCVATGAMDDVEHADAVYLITELLNGPDLLEHIKRNGLMSEDVVIGIAQQVAGALYYMHQEGWAHRDVKLENIVLEAPLSASASVASPAPSSISVKVVDFGYAVRQDESGARGSIGTPPYMSPEAFGRNRKYCLAKSDMWSFGVALYVLLCGRYPFMANDETALRKQVCYTRPRFESSQWEKVSRPMRHLVRDLLRRDPGERPTAREVLDVLNDLREAREIDRAEDIRIKTQEAANRMSVSGRLSNSSRRQSRSGQSLRRLSRLSGNVRAMLPRFRAGRDTHFEAGDEFQNPFQ